MKRRTFWISALGAALVAAGGFAWLFPYGAIGSDTPADRHQTWLLTLWTAGVLAICFGSAGLLGALAPIRFADVADHGSVLAAIEARRKAKNEASDHFYNFAGWLVSTGGLLIGVYFVAWLSS